MKKAAQVSIVLLVLASMSVVALRRVDDEALVDRYLARSKQEEKGAEEKGGFVRFWENRNVSSAELREEILRRYSPQDLMNVLRRKESDEDRDEVASLVWKRSSWDAKGKTLLELSPLITDDMRLALVNEWTNELRGESRPELESWISGQATARDLVSVSRQRYWRSLLEVPSYRRAASAAKRRLLLEKDPKPRAENAKLLKSIPDL